jgi:hypothetical protein
MNLTDSPILRKAGILGSYSNKLARLLTVRFLPFLLLKRTELRGKLLTPKLLQRIELICVLLPGLFFICIGLSALFLPALLLMLVAGFCISFGALFCTYSLKFLALKRRLSSFSHQIEARLIIDPGKASEMQKADMVESKKVVFH